MRYFQLMRGLRGCYMPDSSYYFKCDTRRELVSHLESEIMRNYYIEFPYIGLSKRAVIRFCASIWRGNARSFFGEILPYSEGKYTAGMAITVCEISMRKFREHEKEFAE